MIITEVELHYVKWILFISQYSLPVLIARWQVCINMLDRLYVKFELVRQIRVGKNYCFSKDYIVPIIMLTDIKQKQR